MSNALQNGAERVKLSEEVITGEVKEEENVMVSACEIACVTANDYV